MTHVLCVKLILARRWKAKFKENLGLFKKNLCQILLFYFLKTVLIWVQIGYFCSSRDVIKSGFLTFPDNIFYFQLLNSLTKNLSKSKQIVFHLGGV